MLSVVTPIILSVIMQNLVVLSVVAPSHPCLFKGVFYQEKMWADIFSPIYFGFCWQSFKTYLLIVNEIKNF